MLAVGYAAFALDRSAQQVQREAALTTVADPLASLCASDPSVRARVGEACGVATKVSETRNSSAAVTSAGKDGRNGLDGRDGKDGRDGQPGLNGLTPACLSEPTQCRGADGAPGKDGAPGRDGEDGADGEDGSPAAEMVLIRPDGTTARCPRTGGDDRAPVYTCSTVAPGGT